MSKITTFRHSTFIVTLLSTIIFTAYGNNKKDEIDKTYETAMTDLAKYEGINVSICVSGEDVYTANDASGIATIWKNGKVLYTLPSKTEWTSVVALQLSGEDIYAVGNESNDGIKTPVVWINDKVLYKLTDDTDSSIPTSLYISGTDVYVTSNSKQTAYMWKNGKTLYKQDNAQVHALWVSGSDVYMAGHTNSAQYGEIATIWKNNEVLYTMADETTSTRVKSLYLSNGDIYAAGDAGAFAILWKNGKVLYKLQDSEHASCAYSLYISNDDVYMAGFEVENENIAKVWKNGKVLYTLTEGNKPADIRSIYVKDNNVYAAGLEHSSKGSTAKVWKNGKLLYTLH